MEIAQIISSMVLGLRRKVNIKVRQPLRRIMIPVGDKKFEKQLHAISDLILSEVNVKEIEYLDDTEGILVKKIKPNYKTLGPRYGKIMKQLASGIGSMTQEEISRFEKNGSFSLSVEGQEVILSTDDVEIISEDIPGWLVANEGKITVALDVTLTDQLREEGIARELVNRIQNLRKESGLEVTDKIAIQILKHSEIIDAVEHFGNYIGSQTLADSVRLVDNLSPDNGMDVVLDERITTKLLIQKI